MSLLVFCSLSHDPGSGLAGVLFEWRQDTARYMCHYLPERLLFADVKGLDFDATRLCH